MFEYIKKVSVAINFISEKVDSRGQKIKSVLEDLSLDLLRVAQNFREEKYKSEDLQKLHYTISYLIDLVDYARIGGYISAMNANIFIDSQIAFLKHVLNLINKKSSLAIPMYQLKELDEVLARKNAKENLRSKDVAGLFDLEYSKLGIDLPKDLKDYGSIDVKEAEILKEVIKEKADEPKKIVEEKILNPVKIVPEKTLASLESDIDKRRASILQVLSTGGGSIKDIGLKLDGINEKTLQRDLLELMREKKVIMLGKKRWAKYYLK